MSPKVPKNIDAIHEVGPLAVHSFVCQIHNKPSQATKVVLIVSSQWVEPLSHSDYLRGKEPAGQKPKVEFAGLPENQRTTGLDLASLKQKPPNPSVREMK